MTQSGIRKRPVPAIPFPRLIRKNFGKKPEGVGTLPELDPHAGLDHPGRVVMLGGVSRL